MSESSTQKKKYLFKASLGLIFSLSLFPANIRSIIILVFGVVVLFLAIKEKKKFNFKFFVFNSVLYFGIISTFFYSENTHYALRKLETMSPLIVFPFIFSFVNKNDLTEIKKDITKYLSVFIVSVFLFNTITFLWFLITHYSFSEILKHFPRVIIVDIGKYSISPIYMSILCSIAIIFSLKVFFEFRTNIAKGSLIIINLILLLFLILYARKGPIIALFLVFIFWVLFSKIKLNSRSKLLLVVGLIVLVFSFPQTRKRFSEMLKTNQSNEFVSESLSIRKKTFKTSIQLIKKAPLLGYGIGDYNKVLDKNNKMFYGSDIAAYNSHNQYLSFALIGGTLLFVVYVYFIIIQLKESLSNKNNILLAIICFYSLIMLTENVLERENGVIYFAFFITFFSLYNKK